MINNYANKLNPCPFCKEDKCDGHAESNKEYLEFYFSGNDTRLFIKETSIEDLALPKEKDNGEIKTELEKELSKISCITQKTIQSQQTEEESQKEVERSYTRLQQQLSNLDTKKWSGKTYFEEEFRKIRNKEYAKEVKDAKKRRKLWHDFQRDLARDEKRMLIRSSGPEWWQEPSCKQIQLAVGLGDVIKADHEEGVTGRTRQWLLDLGVTTRLTPRQVRGCMRRSLLNPVDFLLEAHALVVGSQKDGKKKGDIERPFTINERILLSAVCVLQLPTLLTMLHFILPPPKPYTEPRQIQELLFGDLDDERIRYSTPYMEPLPFRNKKHFKNWAFDKVYTALLPSLQDVGRDTTASHIHSVHQRTSTPSQTSESSSVLMLISHGMAGRKPSQAQSVTSESSGTDVDSRKIFIRRLSRKGMGSRGTVRHDTVEGSMGTQTRETPSKFGLAQGIPLDDHRETGPFLATPKRRSSNIETQPISDHSESPRYAGESVDKYGIATNEEINQLHEPQREIVTSSYDQFNKMKELEHLWEELKMMPPVKQLNHSLKVLAEIGDPLAQLPKIHTLPIFQRWLEMRNGKRILSKKTKAQLLSLTRGLWRAAPASTSNRAPKLSCSKREERKLTWDKKKWLESEIKKEIRDYSSLVKQGKVENTRAFFPTMLNYYDHGSDLNRHFRDVFFTYLPAREADTFVLRPWQPSKTR